MKNETRNTPCAEQRGTKQKTLVPGRRKSRMGTRVCCLDAGRGRKGAGLAAQEQPGPSQPARTNYRIREGHPSRSTARVGLLAWNPGGKNSHRLGLPIRKGQWPRQPERFLTAARPRRIFTAFPSSAEADGLVPPVHCRKTVYRRFGSMQATAAQQAPKHQTLQPKPRGPGRHAIAAGL